MTSPRLSPAAALVAYAESLVTGRSVLVLGDARSELGAVLLSRGARSVRVCDPDGARVAEAAATRAARNLSYATLDEALQRQAAGSFDVAIVENLAELENVTLVLKTLKDALGPRGVALVACVNPDVKRRLLGPAPSARITIDYYSLYDAVAAEFDYVRMLGQAPFVGYAVADFAPNAEPEPAFDTGFVPGGAEDPEWFVAVGSSQALSLDELTIVQLPLENLGGAGTNDAALKAAQAGERKARQRMQLLERDLERLKRGQKPPADESATIASLRKELSQRDAWIRELEARAATADARADQAEAELEAAASAPAVRAPDEASERSREQLEQRVREFETRSTELERRAAELEARLAAMNGELDERRKAFERAEAGEREARAELDAMLTRVKAAEEQSRAAENELGQLEQRLAERAQAVARLERDLLETERMAKDLLFELEELRSAGVDDPAELQRRIAELTARCAEQEADLIAAGWALDAERYQRRPVDPAPVRLKLSAPASTENGPSSSKVDEKQSGQPDRR